MEHAVPRHHCFVPLEYVGLVWHPPVSLTLAGGDAESLTLELGITEQLKS